MAAVAVCSVHAAAGVGTEPDAAGVGTIPGHCVCWSASVASRSIETTTSTARSVATKRNSRDACLDSDESLRARVEALKEQQSRIAAQLQSVADEHLALRARKNVIMRRIRARVRARLMSSKQQDS